PCLPRLRPVPALPSSPTRRSSDLISDSFSIAPEKKETVLELRGPFVYRLIIAAPSRRMVVTRNKRVYVDRVEIEYIPQSDSAKKDRKSTRLNSSHQIISYAVFCLK